MPFKLSPSALNLMEECSRCFWLEKHGVWKRPQGIFPSLPGGMDGILKKHFDRFREKKMLPPELCDNRHCEDMHLFGATNEEKELLNDWRNNFRGIRYADKDGNVLFGAVDNLLTHCGKLIVLDYKTRGWPVKDDTADHYQLQMDAYNFLLRKNGYETENYAFLLFYIPKDVLETGEVVFDTTLVKRKIDVENAERMFRKAVKLLNGGCPEKTCEWCERV